MQAGRVCRPEPERGQRQAQQCADLAAGGGCQRVDAGQKTFGEAGGYRVAQRGQQTGQHRPARAARFKAGLVAGQQHDAGEPDHEPQDAAVARAVLEPEPCHERAEQRHGGVQYRRHAGTDRQHRIGKKRKRQARIQRPHEQDAAGIFLQCGPVPAEPQHGHQHRRAYGYAHPGGGQCAKLDAAHAHEQKRRAPECGQRDKFNQQGFFHAQGPCGPWKCFGCGMAGLGRPAQPAWKLFSRSSRATLRASPPA